MGPFKIGLTQMDQPDPYASSNDLSVYDTNSLSNGQTALPGGTPSSPIGINFGNDYYARDPTAALSRYLSGAGMGAGDVNSPFYKFLNNLAPGVQYLSMFGTPGSFDPNNPQGTAYYMNAFNSYFSGGLGTAGGGLGSLGGALQTLLSGGAEGSEMGNFIDSMSVNDFMGAIEAMTGASTMGGSTPWAMQGLDTGLSNLINKYNAVAGDLLQGPDVSPIDALRGFLQGQGSGLFHALGF